VALTPGADPLLPRVGRWQAAETKAANLSNHSHACRCLTLPTHAGDYKRIKGESNPQLSRRRVGGYLLDYMMEILTGSTIFEDGFRAAVCPQECKRCSGLRAGSRRANKRRISSGDGAGACSILARQSISKNSCLIDLLFSVSS
jgi:hypothetical protein